MNITLDIISSLFSQSYVIHVDPLCKECSTHNISSLPKRLFRLVHSPMCVRSPHSAFQLRLHLKAPLCVPLFPFTALTFYIVSQSSPFLAFGPLFGAQFKMHLSIVCALPPFSRRFAFLSKYTVVFGCFRAFIFLSL